MIQITSLKQFERAKLRASAGKLKVQPSSLLRQYRVTNEEKGVTYRVDFYKASDGRKYATCECAGAKAGFVCKHMGAALPVPPGDHAHAGRDSGHARAEGDGLAVLHEEPGLSPRARG